MDREGKYPHLLTLVASVSVLLLLLTSDYSPEQGSLVDMTDGSDLRVICVINRCHTTEHGLFMNITDTGGNEADAFCTFDVFNSLPANGTVISIIGHTSGEDGFIIITELTPLEPGPRPLSGAAAASFIIVVGNNPASGPLVTYVRSRG